MKQRELRIGNWVKMKMSDPIENYQISAILEKGVNSGSVGMLYEIIEPIPLTEEWLERFGFKLPAHTWIGDKFHLSEYGEGSKHPNGGVWVVAMNKNNAIIAEIQYVHQLQNLYFALTGEELTLKK